MGRDRHQRGPDRLRPRVLRARPRLRRPARAHRRRGRAGVRGAAVRGAHRPGAGAHRARPPREVAVGAARVVLLHGVRLGRAPEHRGRPRRRAPRADRDGSDPARPRRPVALLRLVLRPPARPAPPPHHRLREPRMNAVERTDVLVVGSGFGGAIPAYHLAAGGAKVVVLERGPQLDPGEFEHDFKLGSSYTRIFDFVVGDGMSVLGGNCVGGGSVVYFAAMPRAPRFVFERRGSINRRMWPASISRDTLDPWYDRVAESIPITQQGWRDVSYAGGLWAAACDHAGRTANPVPAAVDTAAGVNCDWMMAGCRFGAKQSLLLNYLPAAVAHGAEIRPLHEVQRISRGDDGHYRVHYMTVDPEDYRLTTGEGVIEARLVVLAAGAAATPVILQRSEAELGPMPYAVGRYFSGNGERLNTAVINEDRA